MKFLVRCLIDWPRSVAQHLAWLAPLFARITVGWVFLLSGWGKLNNLPQITENFISWGIPFPHILTPFTSGVEFFGGMFLLVGLLTRISAGALGITMIVAIKSAKWGEVDSLETRIDRAYNPHWGSCLREGNENSRFGEQVNDYADLYTSRVSNFSPYSPLRYFRAPRRPMPHEI